MTTYDPTQLQSVPLYMARFDLGDKGTITDENNNPVWLLQDEEINAKISIFKYAEGVAQLADGLVTDKAQEPDKYQDEGGVVISWTERIKAWRLLAVRLRSGTIITNPANGTSSPGSMGGKSKGPRMEGLDIEGRVRPRGLMGPFGLIDFEDRLNA